MLYRSLFGLLALLGLGVRAGAQSRAGRAAFKPVTILQVPGRREFCRLKALGTSVPPSGRYATPAGQLVRITHDPFGLALAPAGKTAVTLPNGVLTRLDQAALAAVRVPSYDRQIRSPFSNGSFLGVALTDPWAASRTSIASPRTWG